MTAIATDWLGFRAAVVAAVEAAIPAPVLSTTGVAWADGPRPHAGKRVLLSIVSAVFDDRDSALSTGGNQALESMATIVVQILTESSYDSGDLDALWLLEQLRLGLRRLSIRDALEALGIVVQAYPRATRNIGGSADDRALSRHAIELTFCATFVLATTEDAGLIEHVTATGVVTDDQGVGATITVTVDDPDPEP